MKTKYQQQNVTYSSFSSEGGGFELFGANRGLGENKVNVTLDGWSCRTNIRLGSLSKEMYFLTVLEAASPRPNC